MGEHFRKLGGSIANRGGGDEEDVATILGEKEYCPYVSFQIAVPQ